MLHVTPSGLAADTHANAPPAVKPEPAERVKPEPLAPLETPVSERQMGVNKMKHDALIAKLQERADRHTERKEFDQAIACLQEAINTDPQNVDLHIGVRVRRTRASRYNELAGAALLLDVLSGRW